jgi:hypothetical protein
MSTILKALRRLEDDRTSQARRPLREEVATGGGGAAPRRGGRWLGLAVLALLVGGGAGALAFWTATRDGAPGELAAAPAGEAVTPATQAERAEKLAADRAEARRQASARRARAAGIAPAPDDPDGLPAEAFESPVERMERPPAQPRIQPPDEEAGTPRLAARRPTPPRPEAAQLPGRHRREELVPVAPPPAAETTVARAPAPVAEPVPAPPVPERAPQSPPAPIAAAPAPIRAEPEPAAEADGFEPESLDEESAILSEPELEPAPAPAVARAGIPGVHVQRTSWHPMEERRSAMVEVDGGVIEVREGDAVGTWVVTTIEPSGVVFLRNGVEVRRRVGER